MAESARVLVAIPSREGRVDARLVQNIIPQIKEHAFIIASGISPVARARNEIAKTFLASNATHLFMVDDDTVPPVDALERLLAADAAVVSGVTPIIRDTGKTSNVYIEEHDNPLPLDHQLLSRDERFPAKGVGAACILIRRDVIEKVGIPAFAEIWGQDGTHMSEDIFFCNAAREEGFEILIDPTVWCKHSRTVLI